MKKNIHSYYRIIRSLTLIGLMVTYTACSYTLSSDGLQLFKSFDSQVIKAFAWTSDARFVAISTYNGSTENELQIYSFTNGMVSANPTSTKTYASAIKLYSWSPDSSLFVMESGATNVDVFTFSNGVVSTNPIASK